jgi:cyclophilin family peptidyl-prolyl cis-trans isomerase
MNHDMNHSHRPRRISTPASWLGALALAACACTAGSAVATRPAEPAELTAADPANANGPPGSEPAAHPVRESGRVIIHTSEGPITLTFFPEVAPKTTAHIMTLLQAGCYSGVELFRLESNFVAQVAPVADPACHPDAMAAIPAEFSEALHRRLSLSMARWDDPDSGTSSWSIMLGDVPAMDGQYTVFGRVIAGQETVEKIEAIGSRQGDDGMSHPNRRIVIERVEVVESI